MGRLALSRLYDVIPSAPLHKMPKALQELLHLVVCRNVLSEKIYQVLFVSQTNLKLPYKADFLFDIGKPDQYLYLTVKVGLNPLTKCLVLTESFKALKSYKVGEET